MFGGIGIWEICIIAGVAMLIFGPRQLPKLGRSLGESIRAFRDVGRELTETRDEVEADLRKVDASLRR